jgi:hypothetical protein
MKNKKQAGEQSKKLKKPDRVFPEKAKKNPVQLYREVCAGIGMRLIFLR